jgi:hypothetical protein
LEGDRSAGEAQSLLADEVDGRSPEDLPPDLPPDALSRDLSPDLSPDRGLSPDLESPDDLSPDWGFSPVLESADDVFSDADPLDPPDSDELELLARESVT